MTKVVLTGLALSFLLAASLPAQETTLSLGHARGSTSLLAVSQPGRTVADLYGGLSSLALASNRAFSFPVSLAWMAAPAPYALPEVTAVDPVPEAGDFKSVTDREVESGAVLTETDRVYSRGEVGVLYGRSIGSKFDREVKAGYILGEVGNEKFSISVGVGYEESTGRGPRFRPR